MLTNDEINTWVAALQSGEYAQGRGAIEPDMRRAKHALFLCQKTKAMLSALVADAIKVGS